MWPYCGKNLQIFKCPSDKSTINVNGQVKERIRSMVMNLYLGGFSGTGGGVFDPNVWRIYLKQGDLNVPGPDRVFVFLDEREDAVNWGNFYTDMSGYPVGNGQANPGSYKLADMPGTYHANGCSFSFGDGHSEQHRWRDPRTFPPIKVGGLTFDGTQEIPSGGNKDVEWLQDHATRPVH
jgi:prepilin-type processing-associated H-X9-DG protein